MGLFGWIEDWPNCVNCIIEAIEEMEKILIGSIEEMNKKNLNETIDKAYYILSVCDMVASIMEVD